MAVAVKQQTLKDSGVSEHGLAKRNQRKLERMQKVKSVLATSPMLAAQSKAFVSGIAKSKKPQAAKPVTQPQEKVKVTPKVESAPSAVKAVVKKAITHKQQRPQQEGKKEIVRTDRVAKLFSSPARSLTTTPPAEYMDWAYKPDHTVQATAWSEQQKESYLMAREFDHDRYLNNQDEREVLVVLPSYKTKPSGKRVKSKARMKDVQRNNALHSTLERLATFKSVCHLTDDNGKYESAEIIVKNNITVGGVRFSLGFKREWVMVPCTGINKAKNRSILDRSESIRSRTPGTQPLVEAVTTELEDLPPWNTEVLDAIKIAADGVARGYASLAEEFELKPSDYTPHHIPRGVNVREIDLEQIKRDQYMNGLADLPTGAPNYLVDEILAVRSNNDEPEPTDPAPAVMPDWSALTGDDLDAALKECFQALSDDNSTQHFSRGALYKLQSKYQMSYSDWIGRKVERKNGGAKAHKEAIVRTNVAALREKWGGSERSMRENFQMMEDLRINREIAESDDRSFMDQYYQRMEQTYPSDPRNEADRYDQWLSDNAPASQRYDTWWDVLHTLQMMEYRDMFFGDSNIVNDSASYRKHKTVPVPRCRSLSTPKDNIHLDLPPTGAIEVATVPVKVSQDKIEPDFLSAGDKVIPFARGKSIITEMLSPLTGIMQRRLHRTLFGLGAPMPAFG